MIRWIRIGVVFWFLLTTSAADLFAQSSPYGKSFNNDSHSSNPRGRRADREKAVARVGPLARDFVETHGEEAVAAIFACSQAVAVKLAEFHSSGELGKLPRPGDLLRVIAQPGNGDDMALWAVQHAGELSDLDSFDAYLLAPLDYALGLKQLATGAAEARARRLQMGMQTPSLLSRDDKILVAVGVGIFAILAMLAWRRRRLPTC